MYIFYKKGRRKPNKISETRRTTVTVKITREKKKSHNGNEHRAGNKKAASKTTFSHSQRVEKREVTTNYKNRKRKHTHTHYTWLTHYDRIHLNAPLHYYFYFLLTNARE